MDRKYDIFCIPRVEGPLRDYLIPYNFSSLIGLKHSQYMEHTRLWFFDELNKWLRVSTTDKKDGKNALFWLAGSGGTGKSVISATALFNHMQSQGDLCHIIGWYSKMHACRISFFLNGVFAPFAYRILFFTGFLNPLSYTNESIQTHLAIRTSHPYKLSGIFAGTMTLQTVNPRPYLDRLPVCSAIIYQRSTACTSIETHKRFWTLSART